MLRHPPRLRLLSVVVVCVSCLSISPLAQALPPQRPELRNNQISLQFDAMHGRLERLFDVKRHTEFIEPASGEAGRLWQIDFLPGAGPASISSSSACSFRGGRLETGTLRLVWDRFETPGVQEVRIEVAVSLDPDARTT